MQETQRDSLWVVFCSAGSRYAINSDFIGGITMVPETVTSVPDAEPYVRGITKLATGVVTLLDLRVLFGTPTIEQELDEFKANMNRGRNGHLAWMKELEACVTERRAFHLATDSHQCEFGRWYDDYDIALSTVQNKMEMIEEPHHKLHSVTLTVNQLMRQEDGVLNRERLAEALRQAEGYKDEILSCMTEAEREFHDNRRTMMVTLKSNTKRDIALMVDEIVGVEKLGEIIHDDTLDKMDHSELIGGVALDISGENLLLLLDEERLFDLGHKLDGADS